MEGYYKIGYTIINGNKYDVYENETHGDEVNWLLVNEKRKIYRSPDDVILL